MEGVPGRVAASSPRRVDGAPPAAWGPYVLGRRIGRGAMGVVHAAVHRGASGIARLVAVKILMADRADQLEERAAFLREAHILARLDHPNVVRWLDAGEVGGDVFLAMELLHGASLAQIVAASPERLPLPIAVAVLADLARGLHAAHELVDEVGRPLGLVHQDVSPQNAVVGYDGRTRLVDFGIARLASVDASRTDTVRGKPAYLAPEQLEGRRLDRRTDVFALGVMAFELLAGRRLFARASIAETHTAVLFEPIPDLRDVRPDLPGDLAAVVACALSRSPAGRFNTADAFRRALVEARDEAGIPAADEREIAELVEARVPPAWKPHELFAEIAGEAAPELNAAGEAGPGPADDLSQAATVAPKREPPAVPQREKAPATVGIPTTVAELTPATVGIPTTVAELTPAMIGIPTNVAEPTPATVGIPTNDQAPPGVDRTLTVRDAAGSIPEPMPEIPMSKPSGWTRALVAFGAVAALGVAFLATRNDGAPSPADGPASAAAALSAEAIPRRGEEVNGPGVRSPAPPALDAPEAPTTRPGAGGSASPVSAVPGAAPSLSAAAASPSGSASSSSGSLSTTSSSAAPTAVPSLATEGASASAATTAAAAPTNGWISVWSTPWGHVRIDGREVGDSPAVRISASPGPHSVSVKTESGEQGRGVTVKPGEESKVRFVF